MGLLFDRGRDGRSLPHDITPTTLDARGPSRYRAYGEGDDASGQDRTPLVGLVVVAVIPFAWIASVFVYAIGR